MVTFPFESQLNENAEYHQFFSLLGPVETERILSILPVREKFVKQNLVNFEFCFHKNIFFALTIFSDFVCKARGVGN